MGEVRDHGLVAAALLQPRAPKHENAHRVRDVLIRHLIEGNFTPVPRGPQQDFTLGGPRKLSGTGAADKCHAAPSNLKQQRP